MNLYHYFCLCLINLLINNGFSISYNQPKIDPNQTWSECGIIFADKNSFSSVARGIFIDSNDAVYVADYSNSQILIYSIQNINSPRRRLSASIYQLISLFVTVNGDIYFANGTQERLIEKFPSNSRISQPIVRMPVSCRGLFVDIRDTLYCSIRFQHRVVTVSLNSINKSVETVAGTGSSGSKLHQLNKPWGIFVDIHFNLYVADCDNNRIQLFRRGEINGTTIAGKNIPNGLTLNYPMDMILDGNDFLYIADNNNYRIIRVGNNGFQCIAYCTGKPGSALNQVRDEFAFRFDSLGNLYVADEKNQRIQKHHLGINTCDCDPPVIKLIPSGTLLKFRRHQYFHISSKIDLHCKQIEPFSMQWSIFPCSPPCFNQTIDFSNNDLYIPSQTLSYGLYRLKLTVVMTNYFSIKSSSFVDIEIIPSNIIINLVSVHTRIIKHHYQDDLLLNPGAYSSDQNFLTFNQHDWSYQYYYRIYSRNLREFVLVEDSKLDGWIYNHINRSSMTISSESLQLNQTYQFMVEMNHRQNSSLQFFGYLIVQIENLHSSPIILINCIIVTMCLFNEDFYYVNRHHSHLSLSSSCIGNCSQKLTNIIWNVYRGTTSNTSNRMIQWNFFTPLPTLSFFGLNTKNLFVMKDVLMSSPYWRFEVRYQFALELSQQTFDIELNDGPKNGFCSITPLNGTILTLFIINCTNWFDQDGIKDFVVYGWTKDPNKRLMLTYSTNSIISLRLPVHIHLIVHIRDTFDCLTEFPLSSVTIDSNYSLIYILQEELSKEVDQSKIGQIVLSISEFFNEINRYTISNEMSVTLLYNDVSKIALNNDDLMMTILNKHANQRAQLIILIKNFSIRTFNDILFQSSILSVLTESTNELTRTTSIKALNKCSQVSHTLQSVITKLSSAYTHLIATHLMACVTNIHTSINGPLQNRMKVLQSDKEEEDNVIVDDYEDQSQTIFNSHQQSANAMSNEMNDIISSIVSSMHIHSHPNQPLIINTSSVFFSFRFLSNSTVLIQTLIHPLASFGNTSANTNFSRSLSLVIFDENQTNIQIRPMEFFIPRDPNLNISPMFFQNVTMLNERNLFFHFHLFNLTKTNSNVTYSIHLELYPLDSNISYLLIYEFDQKPQMNSMENWTLLCPSNLTNDQMYLHFIDNQQTSNHHSIIYGIRELTLEEMNEYCANKTFYPNLLKINQPRKFLSNYQIRLYQSGCFYLDSNHHWQSDGLFVGPLTNHYQTQCFSTL